MTMKQHRATTVVALVLLQWACHYVGWSDGRSLTAAYVSMLRCRPLQQVRSSSTSLGYSRSTSCFSRVELRSLAGTHLQPDRGSTLSHLRISKISKRCDDIVARKIALNDRYSEEGEAENGATSSSSSSSSLDPLVVDTSLSFRRISWLSWWAQVILTTVSSVTLLFARNVLVARRSLSAVSGASVFWLAGWGILASLTSVVWTWGGARLSRRLLRKATSRISAAQMTRRAIRIGLLINLIGMGLTLLGAEQIVGGLAIKVLTQQPAAATAAAFFPQPSALVQTVEPLDILIVQANTNTLFSHFCSLTSLLYLTKWIPLLDPPSVERKERPR